jgi:hypothetical protein
MGCAGFCRSVSEARFDAGLAVGERCVLPTFLIIGAQKSGTTWLARMLRQHPNVYIAPAEIHYFDKDYNYRRGLSWYEQHFAAAPNQRAIGEKTPDYLWANGNGAEGHLPDVHLNIHRTVPSAKLIVLLRNPVDRAVSAVKHIIRSGRISPLHAIDDLLIGTKRSLVEGHGVLDYGFYCRQLEAYLECFDRRQLLVLIYEEDVVAHPDAGLAKVCRFLEIDPSRRFDGTSDKINAHQQSWLSLVLSYHVPALRPFSKRFGRKLPQYSPRPSTHVLQELFELYAGENDRLFQLLERGPVAAWRPTV